MVRVEPQSVDPQRWPSLVDAPAPSGNSAAVAQALRRSATELGLRLDYPDASAAGDFDAPVRVVLTDPDRFWARLAAAGVRGLGESYMAGEWSAHDLVSTIELLGPWIAASPDCAHPGAREQHGHAGRRRGRSPVELGEGIPGDLCALYTDETMSTSGAVFASGARTRSHADDGTEIVHLEAPATAPHRTDLADAQRRAADTTLTLAGVGEGTRALVVPPGWGELPMRAAERGAAVRTVTLSTEVLTMLGARVAGAGLGDRIALSLDDVDAVTGAVDAVLADEPGPAAGLVGVDAVLRTADRLLAPGGRLVLRTQIAPGRPAPALGELAAWQAEYVSDAAPVASWADLRELLARYPRLRMRGRLEATGHHAETARLWSENFAVHGRDAAALGFDAVYRRMWAFHLAATWARLRAGWVESVEIVVDVPDGRGGEGWRT